MRLNRLTDIAVCLLLASLAAAQNPRVHQRFDDDWRFNLVKIERSTKSDVAEWNWRALVNTVDLSGTSLPAELTREDQVFAKAKPGDDVFHGRVGFALFETKLRLPSNGTPGNLLLHFDSVDDNGTVYLNGKKLIHHEGWNDPFDVPLADAIDGQDNVLDVIVENTSGGGGIGPVQFVAGKQGEAPQEAGATFQDSSWRHVHLPHDFVIEGTFAEKDDPGHGALARNIGWYRKHFKLPQDASNKSVWLDFEGAFSDAHVWLNGHFLGSHRSGYTGFRFDLNQYANFGGDNVIAVRCDSSKTEGWWYEGGGLYRHVWLTITNPIHIAPLGGVYVKTSVGQGSADVDVTVTVDNTTQTPQIANIGAQITGPNHQTIGATPREQIIPPGSGVFHVVLHQPSPALWSVENPQLYTLQTRVQEGSKIVDEVLTHFGIRTIKFDPDQGFLLNGKQVKLQGTCNHQDFVGVGTGMPDCVLGVENQAAEVHGLKRLPLFPQ